ncbi:MAG: ABC transporter ATP-binding protein [Propionibacteriaceae bacterium]|jgi:ABC-type sugar transport system ATPase subunit|nr:ABC transporter ATP-binding protein [Propionibacteriaceae bacterium]
MPQITLSNITKRWKGFYGVDDLTLVIDDNAFVTLLGPSGCGKTTTLRMIAGLETPTSGRISIGDEVVFDSEAGIDVPPNRRHVGFLFQNYALWPNMTVYQNIAFGLENDKSYTKKMIQERVDEVADIVKIGSFLKRYPAELSGGQQQRVAIARTLAPKPGVLFMDEPLSNLDAKLRLEMRSELQRLHIETGATFVYVTHDQMEAMTLATKICLLDNGVLQQYDAPLDVYHRPVNLFAADFVGNPAINFINAQGVAPQGVSQQGAEIKLELLEGKQVVFTPSSGVALPDWYATQQLADEQAAAQLAERKASPKYVEKENKESNFKYRIAKSGELGGTPQDLSDSSQDFVVGVRPEFVEIRESGAFEAEIYSSMPTGMETTVKLKVGDLLLTGVIFGPAIYIIGQRVRFDIDGDGIMLFSRKNGRLIATGALRIV